MGLFPNGHSGLAQDAFHETKSWRRVSDPPGDTERCSTRVCTVEATARPPEASTEPEHHPASSPGPHHTPAF